MTLRFGELPAVAQRRATSTRWEQVVKDLVLTPGVWAPVRLCDTPAAASAMAQAIKKGRIVAFRPVGQFEAVSRGRETWARFVDDRQVVVVDRRRAEAECSVGTQLEGETSDE
jgi:hypothetical protein